VESLSILVDGAPAVMTRVNGDGGGHGASDEVALGATNHLDVGPGTHTLSIVARASEPCGLLEEPRASASFRAEATFAVGDRPARLDADLYSREANSDPIRSLTVRFTGHQVLLALPTDATPVPSGCDEKDALCILDAKAALARSRSDWSGASCFESKRAEARRLRDTLEDSYALVAREGSTTGDAENAQLRARYAEAHLRSLPSEAEACAAGTTHLVRPAILERRVERACPTPDVTAGLDRF